MGFSYFGVLVGVFLVVVGLGFFFTSVALVLFLFLGFFFFIMLHSTEYFRLKTQVKLSYYGRAGTLYCLNANNAPVPQFNCCK